MTPKTTAINTLISIHAPREGCDISLVLVRSAKLVFQSTHPVRGATHTRRDDQHRQVISIHAPREGCDSGRGHTALIFRDFNPRTP